MSAPALSSITTETNIARHVRLLLETLNVQYPLRRVEMELSPSTFCQQLVEESHFFDHRKSKAPSTMPRSTFQSLFEAATRCVNVDTSSSMVTIDGLYLRQFRLDPSYPLSLFFDNKVVVPHDAVFIVLYHLHVYASLRQSDSLQNLVSATCAFIPIKIVKRFVSVVTQAASSTVPVAPQPVTSAPAIRMSTFGLNVTAATSSVPQRASTRPLAGTRGQDHQGISRLPSSTPNLHAAMTRTIVAPSMPPASKKRPISAHSPIPFGYVNNSLSHSPSSLSLTKRLFESEMSSARHKRKTINKQETPGDQQVAESSKTANKRQHRGHKGVRKNKKRSVPLTERNEVVKDTSPATSPITKAIPGSFLLRGERPEGIWRKRVVLEKENVDVEDSSL